MRSGEQCRGSFPVLDYTRKLPMLLASYLAQAAPMPLLRRELAVDQIEVNALGRTDGTGDKVNQQAQYH
jgi:hypothetical protein